MVKGKYWLGFLFILILLTPFEVSGEERTERVIINFQNEINENLLNHPSIEVHHLFKDYQAASVTIPISMRDDLQASPSVRLVEPDPAVKTTEQKLNWGYQKLAIDQAAKSGLTGKGVKIGILDTGVRANHPDLRLAGGISFVNGITSYNDDNGHGTHVAGIIAAQNNGIGTVGVAPDAGIYAVKVLDKNGEGNQSDVAKGVEWAMQQKLDIVNLSITSSSGTHLLEQTLQKAYDQGMLIVAASGNFPGIVSDEVLYPARYPSVIAVGSVDQNLKRSDFSYYGNDLEFVAPGENILSTYNGNNEETYAEATGTSMASPFVTGMVALYKQAYPSLKGPAIRTYMQKSALDLGKKGRDAQYGYGLVQLPKDKDVQIFPDVRKGSWYEKEVNDLFLNGIISGNRDGKFYPDNNITRAEAVAMIGRAIKLPGEKSNTVFTDVPYNYFASGYINSATKKEIISGFPGDIFKPGIPILRGDMAVILKRTFEIPDASERYFKDVDVENRYYDAVNSLASLQISKGYIDGTFRPNQNITRAEFSVFLSKTLAQVESENKSDRYG